MIDLIQPTLEGGAVTLRPMTERDAPELLRAAADGRLWELKVTVVPGPETADAYVAAALAGRRAGTVMPFVILDRATGAAIGSTRFWKIDRANRKLEIGHSWLSASRQRTGANKQSKLLLLTYAFETLHCVRVQFTTD